MRSAVAHVAVVAALLGAIGASPSIAQTRVTSLEELRRDLTAGDFITVVPAVGPSVAGRLTRLGKVDIDVRPAGKRTPQGGSPEPVTIPFEAIVSLERPRDSARNGALLGAGIGAGFSGGMFLHAIAVDRNEMDEWAASYAGAAAVCTGLGALIGWAIDAGNSKPHLRFDAPSGGRTKVSVQPVYSPGRRIGLAVAFSR